MLKRFGLWLLAAFFGFCLLAVAILSATNAVFGKPDALKGSLSGSKAYDGIAAGMVDQVVNGSQKEQQEGGSGRDDFQADEATVREIGEKVITPVKIQGYAEQIIDGTYNWLEGETDQPDFNLDTASIQKDLGNVAGDVAVARVEKLPPCTFAQLQQLNLSEIDPFKLPCRPPGINLKAERAKIVQEIMSNEGVSDDKALTADDIGKDEATGRNAFEGLTPVPKIFQWSKVWPWILGVLGIASAAAIIFWSDDRNSGIKRVSVRLLIAGVLALVGIGLATWLFNAANPAERADATQMEEAIFDVVRTLSAAFNRVLLIFAIVYAVLGAAGLIWLRTKAPKPVAAKTNTPPKKK
jgi:hypothetical protein